VQVFNPPSICLAEIHIYELGSWHFLLFFWSLLATGKPPKSLIFGISNYYFFLSGDGDSYIAREKEAAL